MLPPFSPWRLTRTPSQHRHAAPAVRRSGTDSTTCSRPARPGACCSGSRSRSPVFQLVTGFGIPLDKDFWPGAPHSISPRWRARRWCWRRQDRLGCVQGARRARRAAGADLAGRRPIVLLVRYAGGLPSQVLRTMHVGIPVPGRRAGLVRQPGGGAHGRSASLLWRHRRRGFPRRPLSVGVLLRPGAALRRSADARTSSSAWSRS